MSENTELIAENKFLKFIKVDIKENLSLIVLIPSVIGGLWQILELLTIGLSYVRFFSLTQLVSDGITIGIVLLTLIILYLVSKPVKFIKSLFTDEINKIPIWLNLFMSLMMAFSLYLYPKTTLYIENEKSFSSYLGFIIPFLLFIKFFIQFIFQLYPKLDPNNKILKFFYSNYKNKTKTYDTIKDAVYVFFDFTIRLAVLFLFFMIISIRNLIYKSDNLENINVVNTFVHKNYGDYNNPKILYFNDKYTFISLKKKDKDSDEKILILKTEDVFFPTIE